MLVAVNKVAMARLQPSWMISRRGGSQLDEILKLVGQPPALDGWDLCLVHPLNTKQNTLDGIMDG